MTRRNRNRELTSLHKNLQVELIILSVCEGLLASHHLTFFFLYTKHFKLQLLVFTAFETVLSIVFCLNPLLGYLSDSHKFLGSKKKSYLALAGCVGTLGYAFCGCSSIFSLSVGTVFAAQFVIDLSNALRTVVLDSLCVILHNVQKYGLKPEEQRSSSWSVGLLFGCRLAGKVTSNLLFGLLYSHMKEKCELTRFLRAGVGHLLLGHLLAIFERADFAGCVNQLQNCASSTTWCYACER